MTVNRISRRGVLRLGAATTTVLGFSAIVRAQPRQLVIGGPGGQEAQTRKFLIPAFEKQHNCKVLYDGAQTHIMRLMHAGDCDASH